MKRIALLTVTFLTVIGISTAQTNRAGVASSSMSIVSIDNPQYSLYGAKNIAVTLENSGANTITSFDIMYSLNGVDPITEQVSNIAIESGQTYTHHFAHTWNAIPGEYEVAAEITAVNQQPITVQVENTTLAKTMHMATRSVANFPLFEEFTASTCPPCYSFNLVFNPFLVQHAGQYAIVKYAMNWPGSGDPYYTAEGGTRRNYYGVSGVPSLFTGGSTTSTTLAAVTNAFNNALAKEAFFEINATATVNSSNIAEISIEVIPYVSASNIRLHTVVVENTTTGNVGSNGEKEFHYVMMKMLPNADGTTFSATQGETNTFEFVYDLTSTHIEDFEDLQLVVFIQNHSTKEVLQAHMDEILYQLDGIDLWTTSVDVDKFSLLGEQDVTATVRNRGIEAITSFDIEYNTDNGTPVTESVTGLNLLSNETYEYTFNQKWNAPAGMHNLTAKISNVNGEGQDGNPYNDEASLTVFVASKSVANKPLFEQFTSSTSAPSAEFNTIFNPFIESHIDDISIIKYPLKMPGNGDPYYTGESGKRGTYYDVNNVPKLYVDGVSVPTTQEGINDAFSASSAKGTYMDIDLTASVDKSNLKVTANVGVHSYITVDQLNLYGAIVERETTGNVGNNGETSFKYTLIKMLPNANGTEFSITDGQTKQFELSASLKNTKLEDVNDLDVVFLVQHDESKVVLQSNMVKLSTGGTGIDNTSIANLSIYPNPAQNEVTIQSMSNESIVSIEIYSITGSLAFSKQYSDAQQQVTLNLDQPKGMYMIKVTTQDGKHSVSKLIIQ